MIFHTTFRRSTTPTSVCLKGRGLRMYSLLQAPTDQTSSMDAGVHVQSRDGSDPLNLHQTLCLSAAVLTQRCRARHRKVSGVPFTSREEDVMGTSGTDGTQTERKDADNQLFALLVFLMSAAHVQCRFDRSVSCLSSVLSVRFMEYRLKTTRAETSRRCFLFVLSDSHSRGRGHGAFTCLVFKGPRRRLCAALNATPSAV